MGLDALAASEVVRLSTGPTTRIEEIEAALECFAEAADRMRLVA
jgi:cysteine sulfinate desulfinase/cysteine desulfurase-like protein